MFFISFSYYCQLCTCKVCWIFMQQSNIRQKRFMKIFQMVQDQVNELPRQWTDAKIFSLRHFWKCKKYILIYARYEHRNHPLRKMYKKSPFSSVLKTLLFFVKKCCEHLFLGWWADWIDLSEVFVFSFWRNMCKLRLYINFIRALCEMWNFFFKKTYECFWSVKPK